MIFLVLLSIFLRRASSIPLEEPVSFSFCSFNSHSCSNGDLICTGEVTPYQGSLSLTSEPIPSNSSSLPLYKVGRVLYGHPVLAWPAVITTTFTIKITPYPQSTAGSADGMTFVLAPDNKPCPDNSAGEYLGLFNSSSKGVNMSLLAVELDTFKNPFDPDSNHIGFDTTSVISVATKNLSPGINLKSGKPIKVQINYDGLAKMLSVYMAYSGNQLQKIIERQIIMSETVPSSVYVGFTAATGESSESHQLLDWTFTTFPLPSYSPRKHTWLSHISRTSPWKPCHIIINNYQ